MILNNGVKKLLDAQAAYLATCLWGLFTNNHTVAVGDVLSAYTEAAYTSYARVAVGTVGASAIVAGNAQSVPAANPSFSNGSGANQTLYGWLLIDPDGVTLVAAVNFGATTHSPGLGFVLTPVFTDVD